MRTITSTELQRKVGQVLDDVAAGETVAITRNGATIAEIVPAKRKALRGILAGATQNCSSEELMEPIPGWANAG